MKKLNKRTPFMFYIGVGMLFLVMLSFNLTSGLYARYTSADTASDSARVASFVFDVNRTSAVKFIDISDITTPGDTKEYTFVVSNGTEGKCCEVKQQYTVSVEVNGNLTPISWTLSQNDGAAVASPVTDILTAGVVDSDTYTLTIVWPKEENDVRYANGMAMGEVILTVTSEQVD